jgi:hypothetical protein
MRENPNDPASKDLPQPEIPTLVHRCLKVEQDRNLSDNSMRGLRQYLSEFAEKNKKLLEAIPVDFLDFIELRHRQVNNATIASELCVLRTLYAYLYDFEQISLNLAASIPELICEPPAAPHLSAIRPSSIAMYRSLRLSAGRPAGVYAL